MATLVGMRSFLLWAFGDFIGTAVTKELRQMNAKHQQDLQLAAAALRSAQEAYVDLERRFEGRLINCEKQLRLPTGPKQTTAYSVPGYDAPSHEEREQMRLTAEASRKK